jgi:hypothetical protein
VDRGIVCGACCWCVGSAGLCRQLWSQLVGRNDMALFSKQTLTGTGFTLQDIGRLSTG